MSKSGRIKIALLALVIALLVGMVGGQEYPVGTCPAIPGYKMMQIVVGSRAFCNYRIKGLKTLCVTYGIDKHTLVDVQATDGGFTCEFQANPPFGTPPY